jgi:hypothetical protein
LTTQAAAIPPLFASKHGRAEKRPGRQDDRARIYHAAVSKRHTS